MAFNFATNPSHPDDENEGFKETSDELQDDAEMKWMVDFNEAVALGMGMLEGWESIYVDGEQKPSIPGTGNEDYFNSGFYFSKGPYSAPHWGCTVRNYLTSRCAAYRFHVADPIPFQRSIVVDIDHGYTNQVQTDYSSLAYWYQAEPHAPFPSLLPAAQRLPTPVARNAIQFALFTSPAWLPAAALGLKALRSLFERKNRGG